MTMGTQTITIGRDWLEVEPVGTLKALQNRSGSDLDLIFGDAPPGPTDSGLHLDPGGILTVFGSGTLYARLECVSPHTTGTIVVVT